MPHALHRLAIRGDVDGRPAWEQVDPTGDVHAGLDARGLDLSPGVVGEMGQAHVVLGVVAVPDDPAVIV